MLSKKCFFVPLAIAAISFFGACGASAQALKPACPYTAASLRGSYSVVANYGEGVALGLWAETFDGKGNLVRSGILNQPASGSTTGERTISTVSSTGTYTVNCDGTGVFIRTVTRPDGSTVPETDDFIITEATAAQGQTMIATAITDAQRVPSQIVPGGIFVTHVHTRLPDLVPRSNPFGNELFR